MVALVISGFIVAVVLQMLSSQSRLVAVQGAREEAQQNARGAVEIMSSELRGAVPSGLLQADAQSLTFMQPRAWGLICGTDPALPSTVDLLIPTTAAASLPTGEGSGIVLLGSDLGGSGAVQWEPTPPLRAEVVSTAVIAGSPAAGRCADFAPAGDVVAVRVTANVPLAAFGQRNNPAFLYLLTRYDIAESDGVTWLRRSNGMSGGAFQPQPLAGPVQPDKFAFQYYGGTPAAPVPAPGTNAAGLAALRMIRLQVVTNSSQTMNGNTQSDSAATIVTLRN